MLLSKLHALLPCINCGEVKAVKHRLCSTCLTSLPWHKKQRHVDKHDCFVCCRYDFPINRMIHAFKDLGQFEYLDALVGCYLAMPKPLVQALVPMPISTEKCIERGFDHLSMLTKRLAKHWQLPIWQPISRDYRHAQRALSRHERIINLENSFYPNTNHCRYKHVLMIDDVITTGSSLTMLQDALFELGCTHIQSLCLCDATP